MTETDISREAVERLADMAARFHDVVGVPELLLALRAALADAELAIASLTRANANNVAALRISEHNTATAVAYLDAAEALIKCPIGLDASPTLCSTGSCHVCLIARAQWFADAAQAAVLDERKRCAGLIIGACDHLYDDGMPAYLDLSDIEVRALLDEILNGESRDRGETTPATE